MNIKHSKFSQFYLQHYKIIYTGNATEPTKKISVPDNGGNGFLSKLFINGMYGYGILGGQGINLSQLNRSLDNIGYSKLPDEMYLSLGGGGYIILNEIALGAEGAMHWREGKNSKIDGKSYHASLNTAYFLGKMGFII